MDTPTVIGIIYAGARVLGLLALLYYAIVEIRRDRKR